ncbi:MAG: hypothetical protein AAF993_12930 [Pseudomonadota bacterium]
MNQSDSDPVAAIRAQAHIHHAYLLGLQLMVSTHQPSSVVGDWMFRLFRRQHEDKFLSSFAKLGLADLPHAVACAKYHVLSNNLGGVGVEYMYESDQKAWVRFRYPRWMYHGPTLCGVPVEVSRGFLNGWYAHNGVSLQNPRLGYVCVSEDMTGEFGLCGYFKEYDHELAPEERLQFAKHESPPPFVAADQPAVPLDQWDDERKEKANRNYALNYIRNGLAELVKVMDPAEATELARRAAGLIGLQYFQETAAMLKAQDGDLAACADYLARMFRGMGDEVVVTAHANYIELQQTGLRVIRGLPEAEADLVFDCWSALWDGTARSQRLMKQLSAERQGLEAQWTLRLR